MGELIKISKDEAIKIMENNLKILKECSESDTFLILSFDLKNGIFIGRKRLNRKGGIKLIKRSKTFVLSEDTDMDTVSILSIYSELQDDIYNIIPVGEKNDMVLLKKLE